jgi:hypothetical protein
MKLQFTREVAVAVGIIAGYAFLVGLGVGAGVIGLDAAMWIAFAILIATAVSVGVAKAR